VPFFPVDDAFWGHPKADEAGDAAIGLWTRAGSYCANYLTEGAITAGELRKLRARPSQVRALVDAGFWHPHGHACPRCPQPPAGGYQFHEWHPNGNRTRAQVEADRAAAAERQRRFRQRQGGGAPPDPPPGVPESRRESRWESRRDGPSGGDSVATESEQNPDANRAKLEHHLTLSTGTAEHVSAGERSVSRRESHDPGQARPGQVQTPLLTLVGRLAVSDAGNAPPPAEQIALWQDIAGPGVDLEDEARRYLELNLGRPARDEAAAWVGWLRSGARRRAADGHCNCAARGANGHPTHDGGRRRSCTLPGCADGWLPDDHDGRPVPCPTCRPHLQPVRTETA
jgi:hypothetical protein